MSRGLSEITVAGVSRRSVLGVLASAPGMGRARGRNALTLDGPPDSVARTSVSIRDFGAKGDGVADDALSLSRALQHGAERNAGVLLPAGVYRLATTIVRQFSGSLSLWSEGGAVLLLESNVFLQSVSMRTTQLAESCARRDAAITVRDAEGIRPGDLLRILTNTPADVPFKFKKQCVRVVQAVQGNRLVVDQGLEWFFSTAEGTTIVAMRPAALLMSNVGMKSKLGRFLRLDGLRGSRILASSFTGPAPHNSTPSDPVIVNYCDDTLFDGCSFTDGRYLPNINSGSRRTTVRNFKATRVRHIDANTWAEDTLIENGVGVDTESLVQSHPSIRTTIRNVRDINTDAALGGLNMRGLGDVVEDCEVVSTHGRIITDTSGIQMQPDYLEMAQEYTRRYTRFKSNSAGIGCRFQGELIVEDCHVPAIFLAGSSYRLGRVQIDSKTRGFAESNVVITMQTAAARHLSAPDGPVRIAPLREFGSAPASRAPRVVHVSRDPGAVVTVPDHGLQSGDVVRLSGVSGPRELGSRFFRVATVGPDEVKLLDHETQRPFSLDASADYAGGGKLIAQALYTALAIRAYPAIGWSPKLHYLAVLQGAALGRQPRPPVIPLKFRHEAAVPAVGERRGRIQVRAISATRRGEAEFAYHTSLGATSSASILQAKSPGDGGITIESVQPHFTRQLREESISPNNGNEYYFTCELTLHPDAWKGETRVEIEVEEWRE